MNEFRNIHLADLDTEKSRRDKKYSVLFTFHFVLSDIVVYEWQNIFDELYADARKKATRGRVNQFGSNYGSARWDGNDVALTAHTKDIERFVKILEKCIAETNERYRALLQRRNDDRQKMQTIRDRLFSKRKRL